MYFVIQDKPMYYLLLHGCTVNVERFTGLNIDPISFSFEYFHGPLASSVCYLAIAKYSQESFRGTLKNHESLP